MEDKFGAESKHTNEGNKTVFNKDKLRKLEKSYNTDILIKTKPIASKSEGSEASEGYMDIASILGSIKTVKDFDNSNGGYENISQSEVLEGTDIPPSPSQMPSLPSHPSPTDISDEAKTAMLRKYERLSALARKKSKAAANVRIGEEKEI